MSKPAPAPPAGPPPWARWLISLLILGHFFAILTAVTAGENGPYLAREAFRHTTVYLRFLFLTNAYRFFAPNPGPTNLLWFRIHYQDGSARWVEFPDREEHLLRMPYQRQLAVAMQVGQNLMPHPETPNQSTLSPMGKIFVPSYVRHLARTDGSATEANPVEAAEVYLVAHAMLEPFQIRQGWHAKDLRTYRFFYLGTFNAGDGSLQTAHLLGDRVQPMDTSFVAAVALLTDAYPHLEKGVALDQLSIPPPLRLFLDKFMEFQNPRLRRAMAHTVLTKRPPELGLEIPLQDLVTEIPSLILEVDAASPEQFEALLAKHPVLRDALERALARRLEQVVATKDENIPLEMPPDAPTVPGRTAEPKKPEDPDKPKLPNTGTVR